MELNLTVNELASRLGGSVIGDGARRIAGISTLDAAGATDVSFAVDARRAGGIATTEAAAVIVPAGIQTPVSSRGDRQTTTTPLAPTGQATPPAAPAGSSGAMVAPSAAVPAVPALIQVKDVQQAVSAVLEMVGEDEDFPPVGVHPSAVIAPDAKLGQNVAVGPHAVIGPRATIGDGAVICANASIGPDVTLGEKTVVFEGTVIHRRCQIGKRCRLGPNAVIGSSGFGYNFAGRFTRVPHVGNVQLGDDVDVGACTCVDRAKFGSTRIGDGSKIDNLVQIAHNVQVGKHCVFAALVGIAGSTTLKDYVVLGGHVGVADNLTVGKAVRCASYSAIYQDIPDGLEVLGTPAIDARKRRRIFVLEERLPEMHEQIRKTEKRLSALESPKDH